MPQASPAIFLKLLLTAFFWGGTWIAGRVAVQEASPLTVASWRFFVATLALGILLNIREGRPRWSWRDWLILATLGLSGVFFYNIFFLYGLKMVEAGRGALVVAFIPATHRPGRLGVVPHPDVADEGARRRSGHVRLPDGRYQRSPDPPVHRRSRIRRMAAARNRAGLGRLHADQPTTRGALYPAGHDLRRLFHRLADADRRCAGRRQPVRLFRNNVESRVADGFDDELDELRAIASNADQYLLDLEAREKARTGIATLKLGYNRVHGYYIEISRGQADKAPLEYVRRQTLKGAERYITPELKAFEDKVLGARERSLAREKLLYEGLLDQLNSELAALQQTSFGIAELDVLACLAERAVTLNLCKPELVATPCIDIRGGRHLVVEQVIDAPFVANDLSLDASQRLLVITGPNMGGKSTYMRQTALIAILAHIGSFVPAEALCIGPIDRIFTRIGASDDLAGGRSTFMVEMTETATILHNATEQSLVLMDEIGRGTSTFDGLSLAWAAAHYMAESANAFTLFATHYFELTALADELPACRNVHLDATEHKGELVFLHAVKPGPANQSYGLQVAALAGVPQAVIRRAQRYLATLEAMRAAHDAGPQAQLPFASADAAPATDPLRELLDEIDPDTLTPRAALELIYKLKSR